MAQVQNGANSAVGRAVIQIAKVRGGNNPASAAACISFAACNTRQHDICSMCSCCATGIKTVNMVRDRPDLQQLREQLQGLGATLVTTEEQLKQVSGVKCSRSRPADVLSSHCLAPQERQLFQWAASVKLMLPTCFTGACWF